MDATSVTETRSGRIRGAVSDGIHCFKGIPYGDTTAGKNRFLPAQPVKPWSGVRDTTTFGCRAPQLLEPSSGLAWRNWIRDQRDISEDCLVLNVYTPAVNDQRKRPVLFYIHGGGFVSGSGSVAGTDGTIMAKKGDVVVVTLNHRLNAFGHLYLADVCAGVDVERYADAGNNGILDIVAALKWVRDNIAAFGGDAGNVTIFGQSGGASKVAVLMAMPVAQGLFHKAVIQSASSLIRMATPEEAARSTQALLTELGLGSGNRIAALQNVPMDKLLEARRRAVAATGDNFRPVVDGRTLHAHPFEPAGPVTATEIPLLIGTCETELTFALGTNPANFTLTQAEAQRRVALFAGIDDTRALKLMEAYRRTRPAASPSDIMIAIMSDQMYRRNDILAAERKAAQAASGGASAWMYLFTWKTPVLGGMLKTPHTMCIPFVFGTVDAARDMLGTGEDRYALSDRVMGAWLAFARQGNPNHKGLPQWQPYTGAARSTMIFDNECKLVDDPLREDRLTINEYPPYTPDASARRAG